MGIPTRLAKAKLLATYWDNYINYLNTLDDRQPGIGQGDPKPPQTALYIKPFGYDLANEQYISANGTASRWSTFGASFATYTKENLDPSDSVITPRFSPARIVIKEGLSTTKQVVTAKTTKRKYISYGGKAGSVPFGLNVATDDELDVFATIKNNIVASSPFSAVTMRISRIKEKA